ncbi:MAG: hypothetical protein NPIRA01_16390 [Nitrospirales bacterium]|nr:MAG: hypothetical protein NPIRA01_16390 [Nitrospirales bacterium]
MTICFDIAAYEIGKEWKRYESYNADDNRLSCMENKMPVHRLNHSSAFVSALILVRSNVSVIREVCRRVVSR